MAIGTLQLVWKDPTQDNPVSNPSNQRRRRRNPSGVFSSFLLSNKTVAIPNFPTSKQESMIKS
jgi:hypothetical protein